MNIQDAIDTCTATGLTVDGLADYLRRNAMVVRANARIAQLQAAGFTVSARECIHGIEITHKRRGVPAGRGYESDAHVEIISA